jgi:hypothetical protein
MEHRVHLDSTGSGHNRSDVLLELKPYRKEKAFVGTTQNWLSSEVGTRDSEQITISNLLSKTAFLKIHIQQDGLGEKGRRLIQR